MDTSQQVDDHCAGCRIFCRLILAEEHVGEQDAETRSRVWLQHVHDGLSEFCRLFCGERSEDTVVDSIVQEQYLCRFDEDRYQREQSVFHQDAHSCRQYCEDRAHKRTDRNISEHCKEHSDDACRKVVDQHLEAGRHAAFH